MAKYVIDEDELLNPEDEQNSKTKETKPSVEVETTKAEEPVKANKPSTKTEDKTASKGSSNKRNNGSKAANKSKTTKEVETEETKPSEKGGYQISVKVTDINKRNLKFIMLSENYKSISEYINILIERDYKANEKRIKKNLGL